MSIARIDAYVYKNENTQHLDNAVESIPGTDYHLDRVDHVYSSNLESLLLRVETDDGAVGWGEVQSPVTPEVPKEIIERLLGPTLLGCDPADRAALRDRLFRQQSVRGQTMGIVMDAIAGLDIACWDLAGKRHGASVATLLGGRRRDRLDTYYSGLRADTTAEAVDTACEAIDAGFAGIKCYLTGPVADDVERVATLREELGPDARIFTDLFWAHDVPTARRMAKRLATHDVEWIESPLVTEALDGHERLSRESDVPIAVGEPFRTTADFRQWFARDTIDIAQPDIGRTGLTEGWRVATAADAHDVPIAPHLGGSLGIATVATWHLSAAIPNFYVQEYQQRWTEVSNEFLNPELELTDGSVVVPNGDGLGVTADPDAFADHVTDTITVTL